MTTPSYSYERMCPLTDDGAQLNFWDAAFKDMHRFVAIGEVVTIDATWEANLPGLAAAKLGDRFLWWAILVYNGLIDPITDVSPGLRLKIPDQNQLKSFLRARVSSIEGSNYISPFSATRL